MPPQLESGVVLAERYRLVSRIGTGGTGAVWRAHDPVLDRPVAVKLLHDELQLDEAVRERFRREAMAAAAIHHPHAAVVYDIGEDDDRPFLVMELVEGPALSELMDGTPIDAGVVAAIGHQVAGALGAAHERGLAHRDVKPGNVLLTVDGAAKVVDFGIAKALGEVTQQLTAVGTVVGTAAYLAPEQLEAEAPVDARADVYALGLLLHELLTGRAPFSGATAAEVAAQRLVADVPPPRRLRPTVPPAIDAIVATATRREPDARFADGAELAAALAPHVPDRPLQVVAEFANRGPRGPVTTTLSPAAGAENARTLLLDRGDVSGDVTGEHPTGDHATDDPRTQVIGRVLVDDPREPPPPPPERTRPRRTGLVAGLAVVGVAIIAALAVTDPSGRGGPEGPGHGTATEAPSAGPLPVVAATDVDPYGGDGEHPEEVRAAYDGDRGTAWTTQRYSNAAFGNLKPGVGIAFDLGEPAAVAHVHLVLATPGIDLEVYASDDPFTGTEFGEPVAAVTDAPPELRIDVGGTRARHWLLWVTSVPGGRAEIAEAAFARP